MASMRTEAPQKGIVGSCSSTRPAESLALRKSLGAQSPFKLCSFPPGWSKLYFARLADVKCSHLGGCVERGASKYSLRELDLEIQVAVVIRKIKCGNSDSSIRIAKVIVAVAVCFLFSAPWLFAQEEQVFKGQITQCPCPAPDDRPTKPGQSLATTRCAFSCADVGANLVLSDTRNRVAYRFDKQDLPKAFAAHDVFVIGTLDNAAGTIHVHSIFPDLPPRIKRAKTASIVCDACPRGMAKAKKAAFEELTVWKRFTLVPDPKKADIIFLFSANRYQGDYLTRDGPDTRPVHVDTTYMNVVDPRTGESLWGDYERVGSFFVAGATKDLIDEVREMLEEDTIPTERAAFIKRYHVFKPPTTTGK
jgi:hypothetical protein